ncbi:hypothetical protein [Halorussus halobius]|uniref:hypothetical protein n=1 Tax=Halorussus halobius TaxID=1710537 RepID=UPI00109320FF|nr:hypothetical protein [Halorussus halobius]
MSTETCDHCGATFDDEEPYLLHLRDEHADDLGPIEQRRVAAMDADEGSSVVAYAAAVGALALAGALAYVLFFSGGGATDGPGGASGAEAAMQPHSVGTEHYHGTIAVTVGGQELDFSRSQFQLQADPFHFENGNGERWHVHAQDVTLTYAMGTLGVDVTQSTVSYDGTTYDADAGDTVVVEVNGEPVDPSSYVLQRGDDVRIVANGSG